MEDNPDPVTEFLREKIRQRAKENPDGGIRDIERASGLRPGHVSNIKNREDIRVTSNTAQALMLAFGFTDYGEFLAAVVQWWESEGRKRIGAWAFPESARDPELRVAIDMAKVGTPPEVVRKVVEREHDRIGTGRDRWWWTDRFGEEAREAQKEIAKAVEEKKAHKKALRELARSRKEAPESTEQLESPQSEKEEDPASAHDVGSGRQTHVLVNHVRPGVDPHTQRHPVWVSSMIGWTCFDPSEPVTMT